MTQTGGTFKKIAEQWTGLDLNELEHVQDLALPTSQVARTSFEYALDDNFNEENPESAIPKLLDLLHDATPEEADHIHSMLKILGYPGRNSKTAAIRRSTVMRIHNELKKGEGFVPEFEIDDTPFSGPNKFILDIDLSIFWVPVDFDGNIHEDGYPFHSHVQSALMDKLSDDTMVSGYFANGPKSMMGIPAYTAQLWCVNYDEIPDFYYDRVMQTFGEAKLINWNYQTLKDEREPEDPTLNNQFYDGDKLVLTQDIEEHPAGDTAEFVSRRPGGQTAWIQTSDGSMIEAPFEAFEKIAATIRDDGTVGIEQFLPEIDRLAQEMECKDDDWCGRATEDIAEYLEENGIEATPYMPGEDYETEQQFGGVNWDSSHAYIVLEDGTIIDPTITQFTAGQFEDYPHHPSAPNVAVIPYGHPFGENYEVHQTAHGFIERPEWLKESAVVREDGTVGFEGDDLGNNHKFILTPDGEFYAWGKKEYDYGKGMLAIENDGQIWDELDDFTKYEWERDSSDTYNFYRNQGYATGTTSSGGFFMINAPSGLNEEQIQALEDLFRQQGYKSIVIHESGTRNFFNRAKDALDWLSPRRNPEPEEKEYPEFFEGKPEEALLPKKAEWGNIPIEAMSDTPQESEDDLNRFVFAGDRMWFLPYGSFDYENHPAMIQSIEEAGHSIEAWGDYTPGELVIYGVDDEENEEVIPRMLQMVPEGTEIIYGDEDEELYEDDQEKDLWKEATMFGADDKWLISPEGEITAWDSFSNGIQHSDMWLNITDQEPPEDHDSSFRSKEMLDAGWIVGDLNNGYTFVGNSLSNEQLTSLISILEDLMQDSNVYVELPYPVSEYSGNVAGLIRKLKIAQARMSRY